MQDIRTYIENGQGVLGIEFGSTRIKAVLIDQDNMPLATGEHDWENQLVDGIWSYSSEMILQGLSDCYGRMAAQVREKYNIEIKQLAAIGISGMMHGYLPLDREGNLLVPFRTWRNTITGEAAEKLTELFDFNIPQRWSVAHFYQAILKKEAHLDKVADLTTLAGYVTWRLTGEKVMGIGEASGMFPIDSITRDYNRQMLDKFDNLPEVKAYGFRLEELLPKVLVAGECAGKLTKEGAKLLDPTGKLQPGAMIAPPEGDAGTGMMATNSVKVRTGNVSAGTSVFAMVVLEEAMKKVHSEIDMVTTPDGEPVAMVHCNNCTSDLNAWVGMFGEFAKMLGTDVSANDLYQMLYTNAMKGDRDCGGMVAFNMFSGEPVIGMDQGAPVFARKADAKLTLANFMRTNLYASLATLKIGCDILFKEEHVKVDTIYGHGGLFKTKGVGQNILAAAMNARVSLMETAGEGGPWGMALLARYMLIDHSEISLSQFLENEVFVNNSGSTVEPDPQDVEGFNRYIETYKAAFSGEIGFAEALKLTQ